MAYFDQKKKALIAPKIKALCKQYNVKASLSVRSHLSVVLNIKSGPIDFIGNLNETRNADPYQCQEGPSNAKGSIQVNPYHFQNHFTGKSKEFLTKALAILNTNNHDRSDIMSDYFDVGHYVDVNIGQWDKPYLVTV